MGTSTAAGYWLGGHLSTLDHSHSAPASTGYPRLRSAYRGLGGMQGLFLKHKIGLELAPTFGANDINANGMLSSVFARVELCTCPKLAVVREIDSFLAVGAIAVKRYVPSCYYIHDLILC